MFFQWGFFFFLLNILHSNAANQKMMLVFGKVANVDLSKGTVKSEKNCINDCYKQAKCFVAYMNSNGNCLSFDFDYTKNLTVIETTRSEGLKVAFKINFNLTDCPSYEQLETIVGENDESILWNRTYNGWTFNRCIDDWKVFPRIDSSAVCMQTFNLSEGVSKAKSIEFCEQKGFKLTGVASVAESQWIVGRIITNGANYRGYWIDGERKNRVFGWTDGYTTPLLGNSALVVSNAELSITNLATGASENCLSASRIYGTSQTINDVPCGDTRSQWGTVCGYKLL